VKCEKTKKSVDELKVSEVIPLLMTTNPLWSLKVKGWKYWGIMLSAILQIIKVIKQKNEGNNSH
jgi:hypothetical protein